MNFNILEKKFLIYFILEKKNKNSFTKITIIHVNIFKKKKII